MDSLWVFLLLPIILGDICYHSLYIYDIVSFLGWVLKGIITRILGKEKVSKISDSINQFMDVFYNSNNILINQSHDHRRRIEKGMYLRYIRDEGLLDSAINYSISNL